MRSFQEKRDKYNFRHGAEKHVPATVLRAMQWKRAVAEKLRVALFCAGQ